MGRALMPTDAARAQGITSWIPARSPADAPPFFGVDRVDRHGVLEGVVRRALPDSAMRHPIVQVERDVLTDELRISARYLQPVGISLVVSSREMALDPSRAVETISRQVQALVRDGERRLDRRTDEHPRAPAKPVPPPSPTVQGPSRWERLLGEESDL